MADSREAPLRGALVGYGFIGARGHMVAYREREATRGDVQVVAIVDACEARRDRAREENPGVRVYADLDAMLAAESASLDFVDIATPPCDHAAIAHAALDAGLHVLCEKPLTTTVDEARDLLRHAVAAGRVLFPCHNYRHAPVVRAIRSIIESGRIGRVHSVSLHTMRNSHARGVCEWQPDWRRVHAVSGGGIAMDHGSHSFYLAFEWLGAYPTSVSARMLNLSRGRFDTEDNITVSLQFPAGVCSVQLSWTSGVRKVQYTINGDAGAITVDDDDLQVSTMRQGESGPVWDVESMSIASHWGDASHSRWFDTLVDAFREAIATDDFVSRDAMDAYQCVQAIAAAYQSASDGCRDVSLHDVEAMLAAESLIAGTHETGAVAG